MSVDYLQQQAYLIGLADMEAAICKKIDIPKRVKGLLEKRKAWSEARARKVAVRRTIDAVLNWCGFEPFEYRSGGGSRWGGYKEGTCGLERGVNFFPSVDGQSCMYKNSWFDLNTDYLAFGESDLYKETRQGRTRIHKPTKAYNRLCRFLGVEEIRKYEWVYVSA